MGFVNAEIVYLFVIIGDLHIFAEELCKLMVNPK